MQWLVDRQQVKSIDWNMFFSLQKLLILSNDDNCGWSQQRKNKGAGLIVFRNVLFVCFTAELNE